MHRTDGNAHVSNMFNEGDPLVPRLPTQIDKDWLNAVQEEIVTPILEASIALVKGTNTQLRDALRVLFVRAAGAATQTVTGVKTFTSKLIASYQAGGDGGGGLRALIESQAGEGTNSDFTVSIRNYHTGSGLDSYGINRGVKGSAAGNTATSAGVVGDGSTGSGAYGLLAEGKVSAPARSSLRIVPQSPAPTTAQMGDLYVNSSDGKLYVYNGSAWTVVGTQT